MLIAMPPGFSLDLVRFRPSDISRASRWFTLTGVAGTGPAEPKDFALGDLVSINQDQVNLRKGPSTSADIVTILKRGDRLVITGEGEQGDGFTWFPVQVDGADDTGYVASHLIDLVE
jgi:SH3-like domain-containing protein